jgi:hypothetical protein
MIVKPRIRNPSIPKDKDMIEIAASGPISLVPEAMKGLLQTFEPSHMLLTLGHVVPPVCARAQSLSGAVSKGETETANDW